MIPLTLLALAAPAQAADHGEAPNTEEDPSADLADLYAWHSGDTLTAIFTFNALAEPGDDANFDKRVLYAVHLDTDGDAISDHDILVRFGQAIDASWGVQVEDLPGASGTITGAVETELSDGTARVWTGLREDPFFFDREGFLDTLATGSVAFTATDFYEGLNITAVALELDLTALGSPASVDVWATSARK